MRHGKCCSVNANISCRRLTITGHKMKLAVDARLEQILVVKGKETLIHSFARWP
jgi:hypothetical protein